MACILFADSHTEYKTTKYGNESDLPGPNNLRHAIGPRREAIPTERWTIISAMERRRLERD